MIWPFNKTNTGLDQAAATLNPFIAAALSDLEGQILSEQVRSRMLTECYIYGAIRYLASYDDMHPTSTGELMQIMLTRHFHADSQEVNNSMQYFSKLKNTNDLWEIRVSFGGNIFRILCFFDDGDIVLAAHGFTKKTQKTPAKEIRTAEMRKKEYEEDKE